MLAVDGEHVSRHGRLTLLGVGLLWFVWLMLVVVIEVLFNQFIIYIKGKRVKNNSLFTSFMDTIMFF